MLGIGRRGPSGGPELGTVRGELAAIDVGRLKTPDAPCTLEVGA